VRRGLAAVLLALTPTLASCGTETVSAEEVEREVADHVRETTGMRLAVACPHGLALERGKRMTCTARDQQLVVEIVDDTGALVIREIR
jgi:hypothetical protein